MLGEDIDDFHIGCAVAKQRGKEASVFFGQLCILPEEESVDAYCRTLVLLKEAHVVRHTAHSHVSLHDAQSLPWKSIGMEVFFGFGEGKGMQGYLMGNPVVQAAMIVYHIAHHPRRGAATYNQHNL